MTHFLIGLFRLRRAPHEMLASILIALGVIMMMQPWALVLYTWSFLVTLVGTLLFMAAGKFPE